MILCIVGPTASGKTALSVALAQELGGEIVSFDSMQLYRGMDIGTAKPTREEMRHVPHHMIDCLEPEASCSVSRYVELADACVQDILRRGKPVILVGGTGLYVDSLVAGRQFAPLPATGVRERLQERAAQEGIEVLWKELRQVDPEAAAAIPPANQKRVIRALEVWLETGKTMTRHNQESRELPPKYRPIWIGLDYENRQDLYARIDRRVDQMLAAGLEDEVRRLLDRGIPAEATALQAIGYKELVSVLRGEETLEQAREALKRGTRHYAKRQLTWFRRNPEIHWITLPGQVNPEDIKRQAMEIISTQDSL